jgi:hypothetical protein
VAKKEQLKIKPSLEESLSFEFKRLHANLLSMFSEENMFFKEYIENAKVVKKGKNFLFQQEFPDADFRHMRTRAFMTYSFSIFEIFAAQLLKYLIKKDPEAKKRYFGKWKKFIDEKMQGEHKHILVDSDHLSDRGWQIENYTILLLYEKQNIANFLSSLVGNKTEEKGTPASIYAADFNLLWKVRHLLTHRGEKIDAQLIKEIKNNRQVKKEEEVFKNFLKFHAVDKELDFSKEINPKELYGKRVKVSLLQVVTAIIFQAAWLVMHTQLVKTEDFFTNLYHDFLKNMGNHKTIDLKLLNLGMTIFHYKLIKAHNKKFDDVPDSEKFNFQLLNYEKFKLQTSALEEPTPEKKWKIKKSYEKIKETHFVFSEELDKNLIELLDAHLKGKRSKFLEILKKTNMKNYEKWEDWFIFDRYRKKKEFKEIVKQKK